MSKQFYFKQLSLAQVHSSVLFDPWIGKYQVLTSPDKIGPGNGDSEGILCIPFSITGTSTSDFLCHV